MVSVIFCFVFVMSVPETQGSSRSLRFTSPPNHGSRLKNHVIRTIDVINVDFCELQCYLEPNCDSYNFKKTEDNGQHKCDLNNVTFDHSIHAGDLVPREDYVYRGAQNSCAKKPCKNKGTCQAGFTNKDYQCLCISGFTGDHCEKECQGPLGMESHVITDDQITASTQHRTNHAARQGRLHFKVIFKAGAWSAGTNDVNPWLQIDLIDQYIVTRVETQGRSDDDEWVTKYKLQHGNDTASKEHEQNAYGDGHKEFAGNSNRNTVVGHDLNPPITARYIRFVPVAWYNNISMRVELYGCKSREMGSQCQPPQEALGMENGTISDEQITASSRRDNNHAARRGRLRLNKIFKAGAWRAGVDDLNQWLQIDLGRLYPVVKRVATQGRNAWRAKEWVTQYKLQYSNDFVTGNFQYYMELGTNIDKQFDGNTDKDTVVYHNLDPPITARYIRFVPVTWNEHISMRVELYGCKKVGWHSDLPGDSCKHIRDLGDSRGDGEYWIDPDNSGTPLKVFCDMTTDGGGWLLVSNLVIGSLSSPLPQLSVETSYRGIGNYHNNKTFLTTSAMKELWTQLSFTQMRFHCSKQHHGRTFHVTTAANSTGKAVVQYFSGQTNIQPDACGSFVRMENGNSQLAGVCDEWGIENGAYKVGKWGHQKDEDRLYNHAAFIKDCCHWLLPRNPDSQRWECDDYIRDGDFTFSPGDFWKVFVR